MKTMVVVIMIICSALRCSEKNVMGTVNGEINHKVLASGLEHPWEILWGPDNFIWMTERDGRVSRVDPATGVVHPLLVIKEVKSRGEGGLLGMALHPLFSSHPYVYVAYNYTSDSYKEKIVRFTYDGTTLINPLVLLNNINASSIHNGCRLLIKEDKLFITTGDASSQSSAQDIRSPNGKILRINLDGSLPSDNPFPGNPVWSLGHRNAQGIVFVNDKLFISEHGPDTDDEINIVQKGRNYGWPQVRGFCNTGAEKTFCSANDIIEPITAWTPTLAVCGMDYYNKNAISQWKNSLLMTALKNSRLYQMKLNADHTQIIETKEYFTHTYGRLRDICIAPDGKVYFSTSNGSNDKIVVIYPRE